VAEHARICAVASKLVRPCKGHGSAYGWIKIWHLILLPASTRLAPLRSPVSLVEGKRQKAVLF
jgi:hypothetical protein